MIFASKNESGICKADWLLTLPIGGRFITRRAIKPTEKCVNCEEPFWKHREGHCNKYIDRWHRGLSRKTFFPRRFSVGKTFCVQHKRMDGALCGCGHPLLLHDIDFADAETREKREVICQEEDCDCYSFNPTRFKIVGGEWHREWEEHELPNEANRFLVKEATQNTEYLDASDAIAEILEREAKLEGFREVESWLQWYPAHKIDINQTWRILAERVV